MGRVHQIAPEVRAVTIPAPLRDLPIFLCWRYEPRFEGDPKPLKTPYYSRGNKRVGKQGSGEDRAKLTTFAVAQDQAAKRNMTGVGMALLEGYGLMALDVDNCVSNGQVPGDVMQAIRSTYAELSPSGKGIRAIFRGDLGNRKARATETEYGIETFSTSGYVTLTGDALDHVGLLGLEDTIGPVTPELEALCEKRFGQRQPGAIADDFTLGYEPPLGLAPEQMEALLDKLDPDMGRDEWIRVGAALHHETEGGEDGFDLWHDWSAQGAKFVDEEDLRRNWDSFDRRAGTGQRQVTMASVKWMAQEAAQKAAGDAISPEQASAAAESLIDAMPASIWTSDRAETPPGFTGRFPVVQAGTLADQPPAQWLIKGVLPAADLAMIYGSPGSGKSFVVLNMAAAVTQGLPWRGHKTTRGRVVIIAAEGRSGYGKRIRALAHQLGLNPRELDMGIITVAPDLLKQDDISELVASITAAGGASLIAIDTLAQTTPGANENSGEDMGLAIKHCQTLCAATGATVLLVHHSGKDASRGARGWSGMKGAVDTEIEVTRDVDTNERGIRIIKQKDGEDGAVFGFRLDTVLVGMDLDGDDVTSCVVLEAEPPVRRTPPPSRVHAVGASESLGDLQTFTGEAVGCTYDALVEVDGNHATHRFSVLPNNINMEEGVSGTPMVAVENCAKAFAKPVAFTGESL